MSKKTLGILNQMDALRAELEDELESRGSQLGWRLQDGLVHFERDIAAEHRKLQVGIAGSGGAPNCPSDLCLRQITTPPIIRANARRWNARQLGQDIIWHQGP